MGHTHLAAGQKRIANGSQEKRPEKRKLVWRRESTSLVDGEHKGKVPGSAPRFGEDAGKVNGPSKPLNNVDNKDKMRKGNDAKETTTSVSSNNYLSLEKRKELDALRSSIREKKAALEKKKSQILQKLAIKEELEESEREAKREKLETGFAGALAAEFGKLDNNPASMNQLVAADKDEVDRILSAHTDYEVLNLYPGVDAFTVRKKYREMAVKLHPDRCTADGASDAFQKMVKSYKQILKYAR